MIMNYKLSSFEREREREREAAAQRSILYKGGKGWNKHLVSEQTSEGRSEAV